MKKFTFLTLQDYDTFLHELRSGVDSCGFIDRFAEEAGELNDLPEQAEAAGGGTEDTE